MEKTAILLAVYNAEKYLNECIDSILTQSWQSWELLACNDGSTDNSLSILENYAACDKRIHILNNPHNMGIVATRNRLLQNIPENATFVAWIDSDDKMFSHRLEKQINYLKKHPGIGAVGSALEIIDENSTTIGRRYYPTGHIKIRQTLPRTNVIAQPAIMLRRQVIENTGLYTSEYPVCEDYEYWLRVLEKYDFANLPEPLLYYRISSSQSKQTHLKETLRLTLLIQQKYYKRSGKKTPLTHKFHQLAEKFLLLLPNKLVLAIFKRVTYK